MDIVALIVYPLDQPLNVIGVKHRCVVDGHHAPFVVGQAVTLKGHELQELVDRRGHRRQTLEVEIYYLIVGVIAPQVLDAVCENGRRASAGT